MTPQNVKENLSRSQMIISTSTLTSSQRITPNVQAYAIIQPADNINLMIWLGDKITIAI
jgi:hypothetical protein